MHINILELRAIHLACQTFLPIIRSWHIQLLSNNMTAVVYIKKQSSTQSPSFCVKAIHLWNRCPRHGVTLHAVHLLGTSSSLADMLCRSFYTNHKRELHDPMLRLIFHRCGTLRWDLFVSSLKHKFPLFCFRESLRPGSLGDAHLLLWTTELRSKVQWD